MTRDLKQIMAINQEFQNQSAAFKDREAQFTELSREYREKLELLKFEREKIALKEEQFMRVIHKTESESKTEVRKIQLRYESQMTQRSRDLERRTEDLEDKLTQS